MSSSPLKISNRSGRLPNTEKREKLLSLHSRLELKKQHVSDDVLTRANSTEKENSSPIHRRNTKVDFAMDNGSNNIVNGSPEPKKKLVMTPYFRRDKFDQKNDLIRDTSKLQMVLHDSHKPGKRLASVQGSAEISHKNHRSNGTDPHLDEIGKLKAQHAVELISWKAKLAGKDSEIESLKKSLTLAQEKIQSNDHQLAAAAQNMSEEWHKKYQLKHQSKVQALKKELEEHHSIEKQGLEIEIKRLREDKLVMEKEIETMNKQRFENEERIAHLESEQIKEINNLELHYERLLSEKDKQLEEFLVVFEEYKAMADEKQPNSNS